MLRKYHTYFIAYLLLLPHISQSMQPATEETFFILVSGNDTTKKFPVSKALMRHSYVMKTATEDFSDIKEFEYTIENAHSADILNLIGCLVKIDEKAQIPKDEDHKKSRQEINNFLLSGLQELPASELINLANIIEPLDISNPTLCKCLTDKLASAIKENVAKDRSIFSPLRGFLLTKIMQQTNKIMKIDSALMQPYTDSLQPAYCLPQLQTTQEKLANLFSFRGIFSPNIFMQCHYYNHKTKTLITSELEHKKDTFSDEDRINSIFITKNSHAEQKNYTFRLPEDIRKINHIKANTDESVFIVYALEASYTRKELIIYLFPTPDLNIAYTIYAFTDKNNLVYAARNRDFGILDILTGDFKKIELGNKMGIIGIHHNKNYSIILAHTANEIFIGQREKDDNFTFEQLDLNIIKKKQNDNHFYFIRTVLLHPSQKLLYLETYTYSKSHKRLNCSFDIFYIIDFATSKIIYDNQYNISCLCDGAYEIHFLSDDILFLGSAYGPDHFLNFRTGNFWTKETENTRIGLTADNMHSIEVESIFDQGRTTHCVRLSRLIDKHVIKTITQLNSGKIPFLLLNIMENTSAVLPLTAQKVTEYNNLDDSLKTILSVSKTITEQSTKAYYLRLLKHIYPKAKSFFASAAILTVCLSLAYRMINTRRLHPRKQT